MAGHSRATLYRTVSSIRHEWGKWGKQGLAHSGGKTGLNGAGTGGKRWGRQGMRWEVSERACALPFSLVGRELNRLNTDVILNNSLHMNLK